MSNVTAGATPLAELYQHVIQEELGLVARIDEEGDVLFRHPELGTLYFSLSADDPEFLRLVHPSFADATDLGMGRAELLEIINTVNNRCKAVKLYITQSSGDVVTNRVSAAIESFVAAPDALPSEALLRGIVARCLSAIRHSAAETLREAGVLKPADESAH
jgi:hypothetical protein